MNRRRKRPSRKEQIADLVAIFLTAHAPRTNAAYAADLAAFARFLGAKTPRAAAEIFLTAGRTEAWMIAQRYRAHLRANVAPATANRRLTCLRTLARDAYDAEITNWIVNVRSLKARRYRDTRGPGLSACREMFSICCRTGGRRGTRDAAIFRLLFDLALRRSEITELDLDHYNRRGRTISILAKGWGERQIRPLPDQTIAALDAWIRYRGTEPGPLFVNLSRRDRGRRLTGRGLYLIIRRLGAAVGVRATPHGIRHTASTTARNFSRTALDLREFTRHADLNTAQLYMDGPGEAAAEVAADVARTLDEVA